MTIRAGKCFRHFYPLQNLLTLLNFKFSQKVTLTSGNVERQEVAEKFVKSTGEGDPEVSRAYVHKSDGQDGNIKM